MSKSPCATDNKTKKAGLLQLKRTSLFLMLAMAAQQLQAAPPSATTQIGDTVTNPISNQTETVSALIKDYGDLHVVSVLTTSNNYISVPVAKDQILHMADGKYYQVQSVVVNSGVMSQYTIIQVTLNAQSQVASTVGSSSTFSAAFAGPVNGAGTPATSFSSANVPATGPIQIVNRGADGGNGHDGGGVWIFSYPATGGGNGSAGGTTNITVGSNHPQITTAGSYNAAIEVASVGGNGGNGGDFYGAFNSGASGGESGNGGDVSLTNSANVNVGSGETDKPGIYVYSQSGKGGNGGRGILWANGGSSGGSTSAGTVDVTNNGSVTTGSTKAYGIYALSAAGAAGSAGDSWGIVGVGGTGAAAGDGKTVTVTNASAGDIHTSGTDAHGIFAQSIGGTGGASGDAGGLVAVGGAGGDGGLGGQVYVTNSGSITTTGTNARGIFAESIGGGGGTGGYGAGAVGIGGSGGLGNNSDKVQVINNGSISTSGDKATGIFAQSVGGGGGDGGSSSGLVTIGGKGNGGGNGGEVVVTQGGRIDTTGTDAYGIYAQSVGGGGGNGGASNSGSLFAGFALGGDGGVGGNGGKVTVTLNNYSVPDPFNSSQTISVPSHVSTDKDRSIGIFAQSVGGGGGNGGAAVQATVGVLGAVSIAIGGDGASGGTGGEVSLTGHGNILTGGDNATGVLLQSVGGGGGNGGLSVSAAGQAGPAGASMSLALGGKASVGGAGGKVSTNYQGQISTKGDASAGLVAQSVGGGGGNGGTAISGAASFGVAASGALSIGLGGDGGAGGAGGVVDLTVTGGSVKTEGTQSVGILAQSVGGGGGNGGMSIAGALSAAAGVSGAVTVGLGGKGAGGGSADKVTANVTSDVTTLDSDSAGVIFQSVGGGGGNGGLSVSAGASGGGVGSAAISVGVGGSGATAGHGSTVDATYNGILSTNGINSIGLLAQSVGGGGGNGGNSIVANLSGAGAGAAAISVGLGGKAGAGGNGGNNIDQIAVKLNTSGSVTTNKDNSAGIVAQSIGGGGGNGGYSVAASGAVAGGGAGAVSVGLGGAGGTGGQGKVVQATVDSTVTTHGDNSGGVIAQSVGGGGGNGGFNVSGVIAGSGAGSGGIAVGLGGNGATGGSAGQVTLTTQKAITTTGDNSTGFTAQSLGGGGGNGGFNVSGALTLAGTGSGSISVGLGGSGAGGGLAGKVIAISNGAINTSGENSTGFLAQSLGGGGGNGGFNVSATAAGAGAGSGAISVGLGGSGGGGNSADTVNATVTASVTTTKDRSAGVVAQSIGGGGGNGGFNVSGALGIGGLGTGAISVGLGGKGGSGGNAAKVTATSDGVIQTSGKESVGFLAQSVGGGGGNGGFNVSGTVVGASQGAGAVSVGLGGAGGSGGNAGQVDATVTKSVTTGGDMSSAIVVQSIGGGGGNGAFNVSGAVAGSGTGAGSVGVGIGGTGAGGGYSLLAKSNVNADVTTSGIQSLGVLVQSLGGGGGNGGFNVSGTIAAAGVGSGGVSVGLGGTAGTGGSSGDGTPGYVVDSTYHGTITTNGRNSAGLVAQSLGGGGGNGGFDISGAIGLSTTGSGAAAVSIGGAGGAGGNAGDVINRVTAGSKINTNGGNPTDADSLTSFYSTGILAQSIGGGGGNGGMSVAGTVALAGTGSGALAVSVGGGAGTAGNAGSVTNTVTADVETKANHADGIFVQSLGGGGGNGGIAIAGSVTAAQSGSGAVGVGVGGSGGNGGLADFADNTVTGDVTTHGNSAKGIVTQSIGGGGGNGGLSISALLNISSNGGAVGVGVGGSGGGGQNGALAKSDITGKVTTSGADSTGILTQSLGGGGGTGGMNISGVLAISTSNGGGVAVGVGGSGGSGGDGKTVDSKYSGILTTNGGNSAGLVAQSIGGGGGAGGLNVSGAISLSGSYGGAGAVSIGGSGGGGGAGGTVTNVVASGSKITTNAGSVDDTANNTKQFDSIGIIAQSIGGGGGSGGISVAGTLGISGSGAGALSVGVGGSGGAGGDAGNVTNTATATVDTYGYKGAGIFVQSLGGGGGNGGIAVAGAVTIASSGSGAVGVGVGGSGGGGGLAGEARNTVTGPVHTRGGSANGIVTQSIGGGGGNGGLSVAGTVSVSLSGPGASIGVGVGGSGGGGKNGNLALSHIIGDVTTEGAQSTGILVQSLGGGGGTGGLNVSGVIAGTASTNGAIGVGVGGSGGGGGDGFTVDSSYSGILKTSGTNSAGLVAQSIGGGGGAGGLNVTGAISISGTKGGAGAVSIGGSGGGGGRGGNVTNVIASGTKITTNGNSVNSSANNTSLFDSIGVLAQSIGGGGGSGGLSVGGAIALTGAGAGSLSVGVGGSGGTGGDAGNVTNTMTATVDTYGNKGTGVFVQSLGGGGGNGGITVAGAISGSNTGAAAIGVGVGGSGGGGGLAGEARNTVTGPVHTRGSSADGIVTQSIGGGGGNGGLSVAGVIDVSLTGSGLGIGIGVGGSGGGGKDGNLALSHITGNVNTEGAQSSGILVQSLGGGGGTGGLNVSGIFAATASTNGAIGVGVGGSGGSGGNGFTVDSSYSGILETKGVNSAGLVAQSIGGGGGAGGLNVTGAISLSGTKGGAAAVSIGGSGGGGGRGGNVTNVIASGSTITTQGNSVNGSADNIKQFDSIGVLAQSIGGGGGSGGLSVGGAIALTSSGAGSLSIGVGGSGGTGGDAGNVTNTMTATVDTYGKKGAGVFVQSLGGGGGNGGLAVAGSISGSNNGTGAIGVGVGGSGGSGGQAGQARNTVTGPVHTRGDSADGIITQSIGGGGGNGGLAVAGVVDVSLAGNGIGIGIGVGGSGGGGKDGNFAMSNINGDVTTDGAQSTGILTQSLGGGGGLGGMSVSAIFAGTSSKNGAIGVGVGGSGGDGGNGSTVDSSYNGTLITNGSNAAGLVAQSIGGGGGAGGLSVAGALSISGAKSGAAAVSVGGSGGGGGNGGNVTNYVTKGSKITTNAGSVDDKANNTKQFDSIGILAQSVGGGGGSGGISVGGAMTFNSEGAGSLAIGVGGSGGSGGDAGSVSNTVNATIETYGYRGSGVIAQSLGGGGGTGGVAVAGGIAATKQTSGAIAFGIGGAGGDGGDGGQVTNNLEGTVHTRGDFADAITAASIGGGGGNGGLSVAGLVSVSLEGKAGTLGVGVGGFGGGGGNGAAVNSSINTNDRKFSVLPLPFSSNFAPKITVDGQHSTGVIAQSIGGGGGNGGLNITGGVAVSKGSGGSVGIGIGGFGGDGGTGGQVNLNVESDISIKGTQAQTDTSNTEDRTWYEHYSDVATQTKHETFDPSSTGPEDQAWYKTLGDYFPKIWKSLTQNTGVADPFYSRVNGSDSNALLAQSIGGGGGNGGLNVSGGINVAFGKNVTEVNTNIGIGGFGGDGGNSNSVTVNYIGSARLMDSSPPNSGAESYWSANGLVAQSIGGGGGNGGIDVAAGLTFTSKGEKGEGINLGLGGYGGAGGDAGAVSMTVNQGDSAVSKTIQANGNGRTAILAQSIGGGGGNGGINVSGGISSDSNITLGIGGNGGDAGLGSNVDVSSRATLFSNGNFGQGILAQSIGGGGGNGGMNISGAISYAKRQETPLTIGVGVGGFGGDGAKSGYVKVTQTGNVTTVGNSNHGIAAQSIGGGGGNGAFNMTTELLWANSTNKASNDYSIVVGVGGSAGTGADSNLASVDAYGNIQTKGDSARGIIAQSIGGGGGLGGVNFNLLVAKGSSTPINLAIGGNGGSGGNAGAVHVQHNLIATTDNITTDGVGAHAIEATSFGGGGGDAGMNLNFAGSTSNGGSEEGNNAVPIVFSLGGAGGTAGNGAKVDVENTSDLTTKQAQSNGILAQSIGGGGGNGALNIAENYSGKNKKARSININVGGQPGDGGYAGDVSVKQTGTVNAQGVGVMAQSIGGGGGNASMDYSLAQSDGGKLKINVGRVGGTGGTAGNVDVSVTGDVTTAGDDAYGIAGQSIGNGGGNSSAVTVGLTLPADAFDDKKSTAGMEVSVGLEGGKGGKSGNVSVTTLSDKSITTTGKNAFGILAQSIGGGGGNGGSATAAQYKTNSMAVAVGGEGGEGGTSGQVKVNSSSKIQTHSIGILAQSIGGGGGNGGGSKIMSLGVKKVSDANQGGVRFNVTVGGLGGTGAASDLVEVINKGSITTTSATTTPATDDTENGLHGVLAQSIGGGGGNGGMTYQILNYKPATKDAEGGAVDAPEDSSVLNFAIGGKGGIGGTAGDVTVKNYADVTTGTTRSMGIFAQSVGGGGGNGGMAMNLSYQSAGQNSLNFAMGGNGGSGNRAGSVNVFNSLTDAGGKTTIKTTGANSHGILAMSVGGGGGNGGMSTILNAGSQDKDKKFYNLAVSVGGSGGKGGIGGTVNVNNSSTIETYGEKSHGIAALSIGGGGGNGDMSILVNAIKNQDKDAMMNVSIGGQGGDGNISSDVTVTNTGYITTSGDKSYGIMAQSIGGGGGNGAMAFNINQTLVDKDTYISKKAPVRVLTNFAMGGLGGDGADSGKVTVNHSGGVIKVLGNNSYGIFAQTVSGAGGTGSYSIGNPLMSAIDYTVTNVLGAKDGSAGNAGEVNINVTDNAKILVGDKDHKAEGSSAIFAQRVVGGGGKDNIYLDLSNAAAAAHNGLEYNPHDDGMVGAVKGIISMGTNMINYGKNVVKNYVKEGVTIAQKAVFGADTECHTVNSSCSEEQNIVGGGGDSRITYQVDKPTTDYPGINVNTTANFGSSGVADASAEAMQSERIGQSVVDGDNSESSLVQSIGGGGGKITAAVQPVAAPDASAPTSVMQKVSLAASESTTNEATTSSTPSSIIYAKLGADQSTNAHGGTVDYTYTGDTSVKGDHSIGTLMQSIGGGGGELRSVGMEQLDVSFGGINGTQGNGGNITLNRNGAVYTDGLAGHGLVLQSIGGGGGAVFSDKAKSNVSVHLNTDNTGNGGDINLTQTGNIVVKGERSTGLLVQSLGGGGGLIDDWFASSAGGAGRSGDVSLTLNSSVAATGNQGVGILAQSSARDGQGNISISLSADNLIWGGKNGVALHVSGGSNNHLVNHGSIGTEDGLSGTSILTDGTLSFAAPVASNVLAKPAASAGMTIDNYGTIIGQLNLTNGKNTLINHQQAQFLGGALINLGGPDSLMINDGDFQIGGKNMTQAIKINGSFTQSKMGTTYGELDFHDQSVDSLSITGTATLAGNLTLSLLHPEDVRPGEYIKPVFTATQGVVDQGLQLATPPSVVLSYKLIAQPTAEVLSYKVDFAPEALGKHLSGIGQYFNRIQTAGGGGAGMDSVVTNLVYIPTMEKYSYALTQMSPEFYAQQQVQLLDSSSLFASRVADCKEAGRRDPKADYDSCAWLHIEQESSNANAHESIQNLDRSLNRFAGGFVKYFDTQWGVGMGLGAEDSQTNGYDHRWSDEGKAQHLGFSLNHSDLGTHYALAATYTTAKNETQRNGEFIDKFVATAERETKTITLASSWSHAYANDIGYIRPQLGAGYTKLTADKTLEKGAGAINLLLTDYSENHVWVQPEVELAWDVVKIGEGKLRLKYNLGAQYYLSGKSTKVEAGFEDTPLDAQPMQLPIELGRPNLHSNVGIEYETESGVVLLLEAKQSRSEHTRASGAELQLVVPF